MNEAIVPSSQQGNALLNAPKQTKKESKFRLYTVGELNNPEKTSPSQKIADVSYLDTKKSKNFYAFLKGKKGN